MEKRKIFYGRSSTNKQELSAELQLNEVEEKFGKMSAIFFDKGISGDAKISKRIALIEAIDELSKGDTLYIYSFSRVARDSFLQLWIEREVKSRKANLISATEEEHCGDTPEKRMMRVILSAVNEYEKEVIAIRTKSARKTMRKNNRYCGGNREFGYKVIGQSLVAVPHEQETLGNMYKWKDGGASYRAITDRLNREETLSASGNAWNYQVVRHILKRGAELA
jgi:DNA invertase Pin-like site-specific DNA recombinase